MKATVNPAQTGFSQPIDIDAAYAIAMPRLVLSGSLARSGSRVTVVQLFFLDSIHYLIIKKLPLNPESPQYWRKFPLYSPMSGKACRYALRGLRFAARF